MLELLIVLALVASVVVVAVIPWSSLVAVGVVTTAAGLAFGVTTGLGYHIALRRATAARRGVMPWFYAGAAGFVVTVAGIALIVLGMAAGFWSTP